MKHNKRLESKKEKTSMSDQIKLFTSVRPELKKMLLFQGSLLASIGVALLLYGGISLKVSTLSNWGVAIWMAAFFFIALGLIPYRRVTKLETNPNQLIITSDYMLHYIRHGQKTFSLPLSAVETVVYLEEKGIYGIAITLNKESRKTVPNPPLSIIGQIYRYGLKKRHPFDRFFPYFSRRSFHEIQDVLNTLS